MTETRQPRCFLVSVGTSLLENAGGKPRFPPVSPDGSVEDFLKTCDGDRQFRDAIFDKFADAVIRNGKRSAEIETLILDGDGENGIRPDDRIVLLPSMTGAAFFCARTLQRYFTRRHEPPLSEDRVELGIVAGLGEPDDSAFETRGLPNFLDTVIRTVEAFRGDHEVILVPTGGYKSLFPYMTLAGIIHGLEVRYTFESSNRLVRIPPLPLQVSLPAWTEIETLVDTLADRSDFGGNPLYEDNRRRFGPLLYERGERLRRSALADAFREHAARERGKPELILRTENSPLVRALLPPEHRDRFARLAEIGHLVWRGDRVPEMADHALRHHSDLFHLAERVLLPVFYHRPDFLAPDELLALLCALHLHDCGHVVDRLPLADGGWLPLLPTEIRDHHHVLGYLRLRHPEHSEFLGGLIFDTLAETGPGQKGREDRWTRVSEEFLGTAACLGLYHRKKMRLRVPSDSPSYYPFFEGSGLAVEDRFTELTARLAEEPAALFGRELPPERMILLVSLLRIIDSLDEQVSRTGTADDIRFHLAQLRVDAAAEAARADALETGLPPGSRERLRALTDGLLHKFLQQEAKDAGNEALPSAPPMDAAAFRQEFAALQREAGPYGDLLFEVAAARTRAAFKRMQIGHYTEKVYVRGVNLHPEFRDGTVILNVDLAMEEEPGRLAALQDAYPLSLKGERLDMADEGHRDRFRRHMLNAIAAEYLQTEEGPDGEATAVVRETLAAAGLRFRYGGAHPGETA